MLSMFVKKCGVTGDNLMQASGGQQAINVYTDAIMRKDGSEPGFDIIFMDLVRLLNVSSVLALEIMLTRPTEYAGCQWLRRYVDNPPRRGF